MRLIKPAFIGLIVMIFNACSSNNFSPTCTEEIILDESDLIVLIDNFKSAAEIYNLKYSGYDSKFPSGQVVTVSDLSLDEKPMFSFVNLKADNKYLFSVYEIKDKSLESKILKVLSYGLRNKFRICKQH